MPRVRGKPRDEAFDKSIVGRQLREPNDALTWSKLEFSNGGAKRRAVAPRGAVAHNTRTTATGLYGREKNAVRQQRINVHALILQLYAKATDAVDL